MVVIFCSIIKQRDEEKNRRNNKDSTNQVMKDLEDLMPNKSLIPLPSAEETGQWAKQLVQLVMTRFFCCDIVGDTFRLLKSSNLSVYVSSFTIKFLLL